MNQSLRSASNAVEPAAPPRYAATVRFDTHISLAHARIIRRTLKDLGVTAIRVALSHWHADHIAGNQVFADCEIVANHLTAAMLQEKGEFAAYEPGHRSNLAAMTGKA